jgi:hypothetical protein
MFTLNTDNITYTIDHRSLVTSFYSKVTKHEYISIPSPIWRIIISSETRPERPVFAAEQSFTADVKDNSLTIKYDKLISEGEIFDISLEIIFSGQRGGLSVSAKIRNNSPVRVTEFMLAPVAGFKSLNGSPERDYIMWPNNCGQKVPNPSNSDLSVYAGFRKYERHDYLHTDLDKLYPGAASMQWYSICNSDGEGEGIYCASEDTTGQSVCLHVERTVATNVLSLGFIRYPFLVKGEEVLLPPLAFIPHTGDWHAGSKLYREWIEGAGYWSVPEIPDWMRRFEGWLRVILKLHHQEINWDYSKIPELYDEAEAAGLDTIFLLGWEAGGFARMWPDYVPDERSTADGGLGGAYLLKKGIDYVHKKGGKVAMFLSYLLIDTESEFYKNGGDKCAIKDLWGKMVPFAETYCGEGTWRKLGAPPMPMYAACPGSTEWQDKMKESAKVCLELGADAVLYDIGGFTPYFCFAEGHNHKKPSLSNATKADNYAKLRDFVKSYGSDRAIYMEHNVDIFGKSMDLAHSTFTQPKNPNCCPEFYRYTFPELILTNRELGQDDSNYLTNANYTFVYGLAFDMTIYRCCGSLREVPKYAAYMKKLIDIRKANEKYLHFGLFRDNQGFTLEGNTDGIIAKSYLAKDKTLGVALWNSSHSEREFKVTISNKCFDIKLDGGTVEFIHE